MRADDTVYHKDFWYNISIMRSRACIDLKNLFKALEHWDNDSYK